jgi:hypothetical protein
MGRGQVGRRRPSSPVQAEDEKEALRPEQDAEKWKPPLRKIMLKQKDDAMEKIQVRL